jgi:hypothetical protein
MTWRERIVAARERGDFTEDDVYKAGSWTTCVVGEVHQAHPLVVRYGECVGTCGGMDGCGWPLDKTFEVLGDDLYGFAQAVKVGNVDRAEALLDQIEDRVLELKRADV